MYVNIIQLNSSRPDTFTLSAITEDQGKYALHCGLWTYDKDQRDEKENRDDDTDT